MSEWETFCDLCYYDLWRVRRKNERGFNDGYHIHNGEEARALVELLNGLERDIAGWETKWKCAVEMAAIAENERDEVKRKHLAEHDLANEAIATWQKTRDERDALQEQLDAAIMLGKLQERRHERELEQVREQYRLSSVCRNLLLENQQLKESRQSPTNNQ